MRVLAFDTATRATAAALADPDAEVGVEARDDPAPGTRPRHAQVLLALIEDVLIRSETGWEAIDRLAVGVGPGTFTGLRIGVASAHALARARGIPLVGVSTLASLALAARDHRSDGPIVALIDARRGEAFAAGWAAGATPGSDRPVLDPSVLTPTELERALEQLAPDALAVGDGAVRFRSILEAVGLEVPPDDASVHLVSAIAHARLAAAQPPTAGPPDAVQPSYLRRPDAEINRPS